LVASQIAAEIRAASGNKLTNDDAVNMTMQALSGNAEPRVVNGRLQIGNLPPVALSGESLIQLAAMRARVTEKERQGKYGVDYRSQTALPGATAPTSSAAVSSEVGRIKGQRALELSPPKQPSLVAYGQRGVRSCLMSTAPRLTGRLSSSYAGTRRGGSVCAEPGWLGDAWHPRLASTTPR
jgi:hypothetical protein